jgi:anti-sigma regulatory factor (Ser/Thr protein kinase)
VGRLHHRFPTRYAQPVRTEAAAFAPDQSSVPRARRFCSDTLTGWGLEEQAWAASQVISELATNAVLHARTPFTVTVVEQAGRVRLEVSDGSRRHVQERRYGTDATTGRGLRIVEQMCREWGVVPDTSGKTVWAEIDSGASGYADALLGSFLDDVEAAAMADLMELSDRPGDEPPERRPDNRRDTRALALV